MKLHVLVILIGLWLICCGCDNRSLESLSVDEINVILSNVNEDDPGFVQKNVSFDSITTTAGTRSLEGKNERIKMRLYFYQDRTRGYYNLADRDDKNLQVFGRKVDDNWAIKCVTKLNMPVDLLCSDTPDNGTLQRPGNVRMRAGQRYSATH